MVEPAETYFYSTANRWVDRLATCAVWLIAILVSGLFVWILTDVIVKGLPVISWNFLTDVPRNAGREGGIGPIILSTMLVLGVAISVSVPLGVGTAILLSEVTSTNSLFGRLVRRSLDVLAGVPSIVFGLFGNSFFCIYLGLGFSILSGGLTLSCMVLPILIRATEEGIRSVPSEYRSGAASLGLSRTTTLARLLLPAAIPGIVVGLVLGIGRALAETAALIFTSGYVDRTPESLFDSGRVLSVHIFDLSMNVAGGDRHAYGSALILILILLTINIVVTWIANRWKQQQHHHYMRTGGKILQEDAKEECKVAESTESRCSTVGPIETGPPCCIPQPMIRVRDLAVHYGQQCVLSDVSMTINRGCITSLIGPSGCGKTSFLSSLNRLTDLIPGCRVEGEISVGSLDVRATKDVVSLRRRVGMIFQKPNPFPLSIRKNIEMPLKEHGVRNRMERAEIVQSVLADVGLWDEVKDRLDKPAQSLSGGQQQRLCIARAIALRPEVLLLDEPCSALDPLASSVVEELLTSFRGRFTVVVVTHNLQQARRIADHAAFFWATNGTGCLVEHGTGERIFDAPQQPLTVAYINGKAG